MSQKFEYDGIHLTPEYGAVFIETTLGNAEAFFNADLVDLEEEMESELPKNVGKKDKNSGSKIPKRLEKLAATEQEKPDLCERVTKLEKKVQNMGTDI